MTLTQDQLDLIGAVMAWMDGDDTPATTGRSTTYQDYAQQCAEDLGLA